MDSIKHDYASLLAKYIQSENQTQIEKPDAKNKPLYEKDDGEFDYFDNLVLNENLYSSDPEVENFIKDSEILIESKMISGTNIFERIEENKIDFDDLPEIEIDTISSSENSSFKATFLTSLESRLKTKT